MFKRDISVINAEETIAENLKDVVSSGVCEILLNGS